jgi:hypothetical protein
MAAAVFNLDAWRTAKALMFEAGFHQGAQADVCRRAAEKFRTRVEVQDAGRADQERTARPARTAR